jgi:serine/threonine protein kinase
VKIIQASKIAELEYRSSVLREMAVLQLLSHPGVARLISAFRYSDSAYLVLEYAARGDLHTHILKYGKLEHKYCRYGLRPLCTRNFHFNHVSSAHAGLYWAKWRLQFISCMSRVSVSET